MSRIHVMSDSLASQVAAGEVVERPASVLKELIENSLDAGAKTISVEIGRGGIALLKVTDDGSGMNREDALLSIQRHATSKIKTLTDLLEITHLGFRGEALPSIAGVSRLQLSTREQEEVEGTEITVEGGEVKEVRSSGVAHGTSLEIRDLFFNIPARRKFLKSEETEAAQAEHQIRLHALAFPEVRFLLRRDGRPIYDMAPTRDWRVRIAQYTSNELAEKLIPVPETLGPGLCVTGFLLPVSEARRSRKQQFIFLNRRPIDDPLIARAIRDGYSGFPTGLHPALYLNIEIEPALVDVNVHPAKREVRFSRPNDVISTIMRAVSEAFATELRPASTPRYTPLPSSPATAEDRMTPAKTETARPAKIRETVPTDRHPASDPGPLSSPGKKQERQNAAPQDSAPGKISSPPPTAPANERKTETTPAIHSGKRSSASGEDHQTASPHARQAASPTEDIPVPGGTPARPALSRPLPARPVPVAPVAAHTPSLPLGGENGNAQTPAQAAFDEDSRSRPAPRKPVPVPFRFLGDLHGKYFLWEGPEGLVLMNPAFARERILFEQFRVSHKGDPVPTQHLLVPIMLELDIRDFGVLNQLRTLFDDAGFVLQPFGRTTFQVESVPAFLKPEDARAFLLDIVDRLSDNLFARKIRTLTYEAFAAELSSRLSRKETITPAEAPRLIEELLACDLPYCTPGNKPTLIPLSLQELNRRFGAL